MNIVFMATRKLKLYVYRISVVYELLQPEFEKCFWFHGFVSVIRIDILDRVY